MSESEKIDFVVTGAMTNLAILLNAFPDIHEKIKAITDIKVEIVKPD